MALRRALNGRNLCTKSLGRRFFSLRGVCKRRALLLQLGDRLQIFCRYRLERRCLCSAACFRGQRSHERRRGFRRRLGSRLLAQAGHVDRRHRARSVFLGRGGRGRVCSSSLNVRHRRCVLYGNNRRNRRCGNALLASGRISGLRRHFIVSNRSCLCGNRLDSEGRRRIDRLRPFGHRPIGDCLISLPRDGHALLFDHREGSISALTLEARRLHFHYGIAHSSQSLLSLGHNRLVRFLEMNSARAHRGIERIGIARAMDRLVVILGTLGLFLGARKPRGNARPVIFDHHLGGRRSVLLQGVGICRFIRGIELRHLLV